MEIEGDNAPQHEQGKSKHAVNAEKISLQSISEGLAGVETGSGEHPPVKVVIEQAPEDKPPSGWNRFKRLLKQKAEEDEKESTSKSGPPSLGALSVRKAALADGQQTKSSKYDHLKQWQVVKQLINSMLESEEEQRVNISIATGLQFVEVLRHPHPLLVVEIIRTSRGTTFVTQTNNGSLNQLYVWKVNRGGEAKQVTCKKLIVKEQFEQLMFIPKYRIFVAYSATDMHLRLFTDHAVGFKNICDVPCEKPVLCLAFLPDKNELLAGGYGCIMRWDIHEYFREKMVPLPLLPVDIDRNEQVIRIHIDIIQKQLNVVMDSRGFFYDYEHEREIVCYQNTHQAALTATAVHLGLDYFITAGREGNIKVFNKSGFNLMYTYGQYEEITAIFVHPKEPLLFSSSKDGTIRIWRLDTFEEQQRIGVGEEILGMKLLNRCELAYWTTNNIYVYQINLQHSLFNATQSAVLAIDRFQFPGYPSRIVVATEDGSIRLLCPRSGQEICIVYPLPFLQGAQDMVLDRPENKLYSLFHGEVLVFDCTTNPCQPEHRIIPGYHTSPVSCIGIINSSLAIGRRQGIQEENLLFIGHHDGTLSLLKSDHYHMLKPSRAHEGQVTNIQNSHSDNKVELTHIARLDRLLSAGVDRRIVVWGVTLLNLTDEICLMPLQQIKTSEIPSHIAMIGSSLCYSEVNSGSIYVLQCGDKMGDYHFLFHVGDENHVKPVNGMTSLPRIHLFATSGDDGAIKVWDIQGHLVREIMFDSSVNKICFATDRGDLLVGYNHHVYSVSIESYLPIDILGNIVSQNFQDELKEEPLPFDHNLQLWFDHDRLPCYPLDVKERNRLLEQDRRTALLLQELQAAELRQRSAEEEKYRQIQLRVVASQPFIHKDLQYRQSHPKSSVVLPPKSSLSVKRSVPSRLSSGKSAFLQVSFGGSSSSSSEDFFDSSDSGIFVWDSTSSDYTMKSKTPGGKRATLKKTRSRGGGTTDMYIRPPDPTPVMKSADEILADRQRKEDEQRRKEEAERVRIEESRKKYPIAPDGYVPNSVIRGYLNFKPPPPPTRKAFTLKSVPQGLESESTGTVRFWGSEETLATRRTERKLKKASKPLTLAEELAIRRSKSTFVESTGAPLKSQTSSLTLGREVSLADLMEDGDYIDSELDPISELSLSRGPSGRYAPSPLQSRGSMTPPETPLTTRSSLDSGSRKYLSSPKKVAFNRSLVDKPGSGSFRSFSASRSREPSDMNEGSLSKPLSGTGQRLPGSGRITRSRGERLYDIRPLTRGSSSVMEILPEGQPVLHTSRPVTQGSQGAMSPRKPLSPRNKREQQVARIMGRAKKAEVSTVNLDQDAALPKRKSKENPFVASRQGTNLSSTICETPWEEEEGEEESVTAATTITASVTPASKKKKTSTKTPAKTTTKKAKPVVTQVSKDVKSEPSLHPLLQKIISEPWFPKSYDSSVPGVSEGMMSVIDAQPNNIHRQICNYVLDIHRELGLPPATFDSVVAALTAQLQSDNSVRRGNAVKTLRELGVDTKNVLLEMLPLLLDKEPNEDDMDEEELAAWHLVKNEVTAALQTLTGVETKDDLADLLEKMGVGGRRVDPKHEDEALKSLQEKLGTMSDGEDIANRIHLWVKFSGTSEDEAAAEDPNTDDSPDSRNNTPDENGRPQNNTSKGNKGRGKKAVPKGLGGQRNAGNKKGKDANKTEGDKKDTGSRSGSSKLQQGSSRPVSRSNEQEIGHPIIEGTVSPQQTDLTDADNNQDTAEVPKYSIPGSGKVLEPLKQEADDRSSASPKNMAKHNGDSDMRPGNSPLTVSGYDQKPHSVDLSPTPFSREGLDPLSRQGTQHSGDLDPVGEGQEDMVNDPRSQGYGRAKPRRRGNYTYFEWRNRSPRSQASSTLPQPPNSGTMTMRNSPMSFPTSNGGTPPAATSTQPPSVDGEGRRSSLELPCDYCGTGVMIADDNQSGTFSYQYTGMRTCTDFKPVQLKGGVDYQLYDKTYKYRRSKFGSIREWDDIESDSEAARRAGMTSTDDTMTPLDKLDLDGSNKNDLGSLKVRGVYGDSALGTDVDDSSVQQPVTNVSVKLSSRPEEESGIGTDEGSNRHGTRAHSLVSKGQPGLSPVKDQTQQYRAVTPPENWREFFELPEAQRRRKLEETRRLQALEQSRPHSLPPIEYIKEDIVIPGDPGIRLLHRVNVKGKESLSMSEPGTQRKHRVDPVPGKLAVSTTQDEFGSSNYGILNMAWTTGAQPSKSSMVPTGPQPTEVNQAQYLQQPQHHVYPSERTSNASSTMYLPSLAGNSRQVTGLDSDGFEWDTPLPPPPERRSRLEDPDIRQGHKHYCDYYRLLKKRLHDHVSFLGPQPSLVKLSRQRTRLMKGLSREPSSMSRQPSNLRLPSLSTFIKMKSHYSVQDHIQALQKSRTVMEGQISRLTLENSKTSSSNVDIVHKTINDDKNNVEGYDSDSDSSLEVAIHKDLSTGTILNTALQDNNSLTLKTVLGAS